MSGLQWDGKIAQRKLLCLRVHGFASTRVLEGKDFCQTRLNPDALPCFQALLSLPAVLHLSSVLSFPWNMWLSYHVCPASSISCFQPRLGLSPGAVLGAYCPLHCVAFIVLQVQLPLSTLHILTIFQGFFFFPSTISWTTQNKLVAYAVLVKVMILGVPVARFGRGHAWSSGHLRVTGCLGRSTRMDCPLFWSKTNRDPSGAA